MARPIPDDGRADVARNERVTSPRNAYLSVPCSTLATSPLADGVWGQGPSVVAPAKASRSSSADPVGRYRHPDSPPIYGANRAVVCFFPVRRGVDDVARPEPTQQRTPAHQVFHCHVGRPAGSTELDPDGVRHAMSVPHLRLAMLPVADQGFVSRRSIATSPGAVWSRATTASSLRGCACHVKGLWCQQDPSVERRRASRCRDKREVAHSAANARQPILG